MIARLKFSQWYHHGLKCVPNALTLCNSLCGFFAIICMLQLGEKPTFTPFNIAAIMIFSAMIFDAADGLAARALNAASMHGIQMDSLSDMVTFGVAPAVMVTVLTALRVKGLHGSLAVLTYIGSAVYLGGAALRLATYNVYAITGTKKNPNFFSGLPSPGAAAALCVLIFVEKEHGKIFGNMPYLMPLYAGILGLLMVSTIPYIHAGRYIMSIKRNRKRLFFLIVLGVIVAFFGSAGLAGIVTIYVLSGPIMWIKEKFFPPKKGEKA